MPNQLSLPLLTLLCLGLLSLPALGTVKEGENLLINGSFDAEQVDFPEFWSASSARDAGFSRTGGLEGRKASVVLKGDGTVPGTASVRQQGLTLVAGETYKLSIWVKTKGFQCRSGGAVIHNNGWTSATGITNLPADSEWTFREKILTMPPSSNHEYGLALYAVNPIGEIQFADLKLEAVSEAARKGSTSQAALVAAPRLVPLQPLLNRIPRANPELTFRLYGILPDKREAYECLFTADAGPDPQPVPVEKDGRVIAGLGGLARGDHSLKATVRHRETRASILETDYPVSMVELSPVNFSRIRPLNNLVAELINKPVESSPEPQSFAFMHPRDGWVFVAFIAATPAPDLTVKIDEGLPAITATTDRLEAFRELPRGEHRVTVTGNRCGARLIVRSIPEILDYPPCASSQVRENGSYGWDFMKKHVLNAVTTLNGGALPGDALEEAKSRGLRWLANFNVEPMGEPGELRGRMEKHAGMTRPQYDGFTSDELFFGRVTMSKYTQALQRLRNPENRLVYTWIVGKPSIPSLHTEFMSAALNASKGRGRLLFEAYCHPQADEQAARAYLDGMIGETIRRFNAFFPEAAAGTGVIFGNFDQIPIISLEHDPAVDFKYFLDMQVSLIANSPDCKNLAMTGYWGTYYGDEELVRWSFKLMRHYAVEGNREMLSTRYGFTYNPGLLLNGDFAKGLESWTASPAATGSVRADKIAGYGKAAQGRWGAGGAGDTVCVLVRQAGEPNRLSQTATGLQAGKAYCLQFVTADFKDVTAKRYNPRRYGINVDLESAEILKDRSFVHVDRRKQDVHQQPGAGHINLHRIIFRARSSTQPVVFTDAGATPGEELMLNFVQLKPYLE